MTSGCGCASCVANGVAPRRVSRSAKTVAAPAPIDTVPDSTFMQELEQLAEDLRRSNPNWSYHWAVLQASAALRGAPVEDPGRVVLHHMAERYALAHGCGYAQALRAVSAEHERRFSPSSVPQHIRDRAALDLRARRLMSRKPSLTYREALLAASRAPSTYIAPRVEDTAGGGTDVPQDDSLPELPTPEQITAYAKKNGLTYKAALKELVAALTAEED